MEAFLRELIHTLRNRMNGMVLEATDLGERLAERFPSPQPGLPTMQEEVQPMINQARDVANWLKSVRDKVEPPDARPAEIPLATWAEQTARELGCPLETEMKSADDVIAHWDAAIVRDALRELWTNACESVDFDHSSGSTAGGNVNEVRPARITLAIQPKAAVWRIINPAPTREAMRLSQDDISRFGRLGFTRRRQRLGLGCAFARKAAEWHGGTCTWSLIATPADVVTTLTLPLRIPPA